MSLDDLTLFFDAKSTGFELRESPSQSLFSDVADGVNPLPNEWPTGLFYFKGSKTRLCGVHIYYDFAWRDKFSHGRKTFRSGQDLAAFIKSKCPTGKSPALLLTCRSDVQAGIRSTETHLIMVVHIDNYLNFDMGPAGTYLLSSTGTSLEVLEEIERNPNIVEAIVSKHLNEDLIKRWIEDDPLRSRQVQAIVNKISPSQSLQNPLQNLLDAWTSSGVPDDDAQTLLRVIGKDVNLSNFISVLAERSQELSHLTLAADDTRRMVAAALRTSHRSDAIVKLKELIAADKKEEEFQKLLDENWWMLGSQYIQRLQRRQVTAQERYDLLLKGADGYYDIIELKRASGNLFKRDHGKWIVASDVSDAVGQLAHYISEIEASRDNAFRRYAVDLYKLCGFVVIGCIDEMDPDVSDKRAAMRMYNSHLSRMRVLTYDELLRIAQNVVEANIGEIAYAAEIAHQRTNLDSNASI